MGGANIKEKEKIALGLDKQYSYLPLIYKHLMRFINYSNWAGYINEIFINCRLQNNFALELASGTCALAHKLRKYFPDIITTDYSFKMLSASEDYLIPRVCCDMKALPFKSKFDLLISAFDSVNYLLEPKDISAMISEAAVVTKNNGIFTFDVSLEKNSVKSVSHLNRKGKFNGISYMQKSEYDPNERIHTNSFVLLLPDGRIIEEVHKQKIYELFEYFKFIEGTGFFVEDCFDEFSFKDAAPNSSRAQFVLRRRETDA